MSLIRQKNVADTAKATIDAQIETAKGQIEQSMETAKETVSTKMTESLTAIDRNQQVNQVVTLLEPQVMSVVDYVLPDPNPGAKDASDDEHTKILDLQPQQALKTTLRLGKNVSKRIQKRWIAASLKISSLSSRVENNISHIDLITYSKAIPSCVAGVYDQWPVLQEGMKRKIEERVQTIHDGMKQKMEETMEGIAQPYQGLALQQFDNIRQFGSLQLVRLNIQMKPMVKAGVQISTKTAGFFGVIIENEQLLKLLKNYPQLHDYFVDLLGEVTGPPLSKTRNSTTVENAKVESAKEMGLLQR